MLRCPFATRCSGVLSPWIRGAPWCNRQGRIEHIRQNVVIDREAAAALFGSGFVSATTRYLLSDETDDIVQHAGVVRVHPGPLVPRRGEQPIRRVFEAQHRMHARSAQCRCLVDRDNSGVGMRRAQHLMCSKPSIAVSKV